MKTYINLIISLLISFFELSGQSLADKVDFPDSAHDKYWYYRFRLTNQFTKVGENPGNSMIGSIRNRHVDSNDNTISYGDQTIHLGWYLGVLATEYRLLKNQGQDAEKAFEKTKYELYCALKSYWRLNYYANGYAPFFHAPKFDGYFVRNNVNDNYIQENFNHFNDKNDYFGMKQLDRPQGAFTPLNYNEGINDMSQDQWIHIVMGLTLVQQLCTNETVTRPNGTIITNSDEIENFHYFKSFAESAIKKLIDYAENDGWELRTPNGEEVGRNGSLGAEDIWTIAHGIIGIADHVVSHSYADDLYMPITWKSWWQNTQDSWAFIKEHDPSHIVCTTAALSNNWKKNGQNVTREKLYYWARNDGLGSTQLDNWHGFYLLLWKVVNQTAFNTSHKDEIGINLNDIFNNIPNNGLRFENDPVQGSWNSTNRFIKGWEYQTQGDVGSKGHFNALDFMLIHNLYYLSGIDNSLPKYKSLINNQLNTPVNTDNNLTVTSIGFENIIATSIFTGNGNVELIAMESIAFAPGFSVERGVNFTARIEEVKPSSGLNKKTANNNGFSKGNIDYKDHYYYVPQNKDAYENTSFDSNISRLDAYYNEFSNLISINTKANEIGKTANIFNSTGQLIKTIKINTTSNTYHCELTPGVYIVSILSKESNLSKKILVK